MVPHEFGGDANSVVKMAGKFFGKLLRERNEFS
jgi:hypothetical protein